MTITETLKKTVDDLKLDERFTEIASQTEKAFKTAVEKVGTFANDKRSDIDGIIEKEEGELKERNEGK